MVPPYGRRKKRRGGTAGPCFSSAGPAPQTRFWRMRPRWCGQRLSRVTRSPGGQRWRRMSSSRVARARRSVSRWRPAPRPSRRPPVRGSRHSSSWRRSRGWPAPASSRPAEARPRARVSRGRSCCAKKTWPWIAVSGSFPSFRASGSCPEGCAAAHELRFAPSSGTSQA